MAKCFLLSMWTWSYKKIRNSTSQSFTNKSQRSKVTSDLSQLTLVQILMPGKKSKKQKQSWYLSGLRNHPKPSPVRAYRQFVFDQSSAHASLPPDAHKAFTMNLKSNRGAWHKQKNTVIPQSNPDLNSMESLRKWLQWKVNIRKPAKFQKPLLTESSF